MIPLASGGGLFASGKEPLEKPYSSQLKQISNVQLPMGKRLAAYQSFFELEAEILRNALLEVLEIELVDNQGEGFTVMAANHLIAEFPEDRKHVLSFVEKNIPSWSSHNQMIILQALQSSLFHSQPKQCLPIARTIIRQGMREEDRQKQQAVGKLRLTSFDTALSFLSKSSDVNDFQLIKDAVRQFPESHWRWWCLPEKPLDDNFRDLASQTYRNEKNSLIGRVAAASSIAKIDEKAAEFADQKIEEFLLRFDNYQLASATDRSEYTYLRANMPILNGLRRLPKERAETLIMQALQSKNEFIQVFAGIEAVLGLPKMFLESEHGFDLYSENLRNHLLGALIFYHPELKLEVKKKYPNRSFEKVISSLNKHGQSVIFGEVFYIRI